MQRARQACEACWWTAGPPIFSRRDRFRRMRPPIELGEAPAQPVLDGAIGLALATGVPLRLHSPLAGADLQLALAAVKLGDPAAVDGIRDQLSRPGAEVALPRPRAGVHVLDLPAQGAVARCLCALAWPLAVLGKPAE